MHAGNGPKATVGRVEHDRGGGVEPDDHPSCAKRQGLQLHRVLVDQLDAFVHGGGIGDVDHRDRGRIDPCMLRHCGNPIDLSRFRVPV
jgi:hypothetical protein